jgi:hypothetical protein
MTRSGAGSNAGAGLAAFAPVAGPVAIDAIQIKATGIVGASDPMQHVDMPLVSRLTDGLEGTSWCGARSRIRYLRRGNGPFAALTPGGRFRDNVRAIVVIGEEIAHGVGNGDLDLREAFGGEAPAVRAAPESRAAELRRRRRYSYCYRYYSYCHRCYCRQRYYCSH